MSREQRFIIEHNRCPCGHRWVSSEGIFYKYWPVADEVKKEAVLEPTVVWFICLAMMLFSVPGKLLLKYHKKCVDLHKMLISLKCANAYRVSCIIWRCWQWTQQLEQNVFKQRGEVLGGSDRYLRKSPWEGSSAGWKKVQKIGKRRIAGSLTLTWCHDISGSSECSFLHKNNQNSSKTFVLL